MLASGLGPSCLTHLEIRRQNLRVLQGAPIALIDWSNALLAPAELELARAGEYSLIRDNGLEFSALCSGYALAGGVVDMQSAIWPILQLDAALMLAVVFDSVAPDPHLHRMFCDRVRLLIGSLDLG